MTKKQKIAKAKKVIGTGNAYIEFGKLLIKLGQSEIDYINGVNYISGEELLSKPGLAKVFERTKPKREAK